jgi:signal transduction histidine kinase
MVEAGNELAQVADPASLLETLFAEAPVAFAIAHVDGRCLVVNRAFVALFGSSPPPDYNIFQDELVAAQGLLPYVERAFGGEPVVVPAFWYDAGELAHVPVEGRRVAIEVSMTPLTDRAGEVRHVALWYKDVTAAHELGGDRHLLRTLFELAPEPIVIANATTGKIDDANDAAVRLFGQPRQALMGLGHIDLSPEHQPDGRRSRDAIAAYVARVRAGEALEIEWMYETRTCEPLPCVIRLAHVPADGRVLCRVTIDDLRPRRRAEAERARIRELEEQNLRIHEANRLKSEFLAAMSHEVRTPLNAIIGFSELLFYGRVEPGSPEHQEFLGDILTSGRHLLQLINDVLDLAKVEAGKLAFHPVPVVIETVIAEVIGLLRTQSLQKRIRVRIDVDRALEVVVIDPARLKQVLYNYLSNALKFTPEGGSIVVRTCAEAPDRFRLEVEDTGIGIAADHLGRLFAEFEQVAAGPRPQGTGLGLALTRKIVEAQGGTVGCRSTLGQGSVFHAVLPRQAIASAPTDS